MDRHVLNFDEKEVSNASQRKDEQAQEGWPKELVQVALLHLQRFFDDSAEGAGVTRYLKVVQRLLEHWHVGGLGVTEVLEVVVVVDQLLVLVEADIEFGKVEIDHLIIVSVGEQVLFGELYFPFFAFPDAIVGSLVSFAATEAC